VTRSPIAASFPSMSGHKSRHIAARGGTKARVEPGFVSTPFAAHLRRLDALGIEGGEQLALGALFARYGERVGRVHSEPAEEALAALERLSGAEPRQDECGFYRSPIHLPRLRETLGRLAGLHGRFGVDLEERIREVRAEIGAYIDQCDPGAAKEDLTDSVNMFLASVDALAHALRLKVGAVWPFAGGPNERTALIVDARQGLTAQYMLLTLGTEIVRAPRSGRGEISGAAGARRMSRTMDELAYWGGAGPPNAVANGYDKRRTQLRRAMNPLPGRRPALPRRHVWQAVADAYVEEGRSLNDRNPWILVPQRPLLPI
jgi:hypothetical protein